MGQGVMMRFSRSKTLWLLPLSFFLLSFASPAHAQFWTKKSYLHWSASECRQILTNSPWAQSRSFSRSYIPNGMEPSQVAVPATAYAGTLASNWAGPGPSLVGPPPPGRQQLAEVTFTAQFYSAMPVREAEVRLQQIQMHYDRMTPAQKKAFDESAARFLEFSYPKYAVVRVLYSTNVEAYKPAIYAYWQKQTTAKLRTMGYLSVNGQAILPVRYQLAPPQDRAFFLYFPREVRNKPILNPAHKSLVLQVTNSTLKFTKTFAKESLSQGISSLFRNAGNLEFTFNVRKMVLHGKVAY